MSEVVVAGSLLSADLSDIGSEFGKYSKWGLKVVHIDVMDGHFAPNLTFGPDVFKGMSGNIDIPVDIHMMVEKPMDYVERFAEIFNVGEFEFGRNWYGVHIETYMDKKGRLDMEKLRGDLVKISGLGFLTTVVINPDTSEKVLVPLLEEGLVDKVLVMTVWPGFSGQKMIGKCVAKVARVREILGESGVLLSVDGGVNEETFSALRKAGADFIVSGSYLMKAVNAKEFGERLGILKD